MNKIGYCCIGTVIAPLMEVGADALRSPHRRHGAAPPTPVVTVRLARVHVAPIRPGNVQAFFPEANPLLSPTVREPVSGVPDYNAVVEVLPVPGGDPEARTTSRASRVAEGRRS